MQTFIVGGNTVALIDGELWMKLAPTSAEEQTGAPQPDVAKHRKRKPTSWSKLIGPKTRKPRSKNLDEGQKQEIRSLHRNGVSVVDLAKQFNLGESAVRRAVNGKPEKHDQVPLKGIHGYRCTNCGRTFKSILSKLDAYCPLPTCNKSTELEEIPAEEVG